MNQNKKKLSNIDTILEISALHDILGYDLPATDIDFILCEYNNLETVAVIEYKRGFSANIHDCAGLKVLSKLLDKSDTPLVVVQYSEDFKKWKRQPFNEAGKKITYVTFSTFKGFVKWLYDIRNIQFPIDLFDGEFPIGMNEVFAIRKKKS